MKETFELIFWSAIVCSFWIFGVYAVMLEHMLLGSVGAWLNLKLPKMVSKVLFGCTPCMASFWGTVFFFTVLYSQTGLLWWVPFVVMLCGINFVVSQVIYE